MKRVFHTIVATAVCGMVPSLVATPSAHAQAKTVLTAKTEANPAVNVILDGSDGSKLSGQGKNEAAQLFANSDWQILDNGQIVITKENKPVASTGFWTNQNQSFFLLHASDSKRTVNGIIRRSPEKPTEGYTEMFIALPLANGQGAVTYHIVASLTFAQPQQPGNNGNGGGGFGGFGIQ